MHSTIPALLRLVWGFHFRVEATQLFSSKSVAPSHSDRSSANSDGSSPTTAEAHPQRWKHTRGCFELFGVFGAYVCKVSIRIYLSVLSFRKGKLYRTLHNHPQNTTFFSKHPHLPLWKRHLTKIVANRLYGPDYTPLFMNIYEIYAVPLQFLF